MRISFENLHKALLVHLRNNGI